MVEMTILRYDAAVRLKFGSSADGGEKMHL